MTKVRYLGDFCEETKSWSNRYKGSDIKFPVMDIDDRLRAVEARLLIIDPPPGVLSKYPALAEAYREYKLIERLTIENE